MYSPSVIKLDQNTSVLWGLATTCLRIELLFASRRLCEDNLHGACRVTSTRLFVFGLAAPRIRSCLVVIKPVLSVE